jgi:hypothetical protein
MDRTTKGVIGIVHGHCECNKIKSTDKRVLHQIDRSRGKAQSSINSMYEKASDYTQLHH